MSVPDEVLEELVGVLVGYHALGGADDITDVLNELLAYRKECEI